MNNFCSIEQAKKLKTSGWETKTEFKWQYYHLSKEWRFELCESFDEGSLYAPDSYELLYEIKKNVSKIDIEIKNDILRIYIDGLQWQFNFDQGVCYNQFLIGALVEGYYEISKINKKNNDIKILQDKLDELRKEIDKINCYINVRGMKETGGNWIGGTLDFNYSVTVLEKTK